MKLELGHEDKKDVNGLTILKEFSRQEKGTEEKELSLISLENHYLLTSLWLP